jgi:pimeloyl-ACP methyl ester carboxylesterase
MAKVRANGIDIEYEAYGEAGAPPLLLIHGFAQQLLAWPPELIAGLTAAGLRVIVYDNRDTGLSQKWDGQIPDIKAAAADVRAGRKPDVPYTLDDMAADAAGLLDALGIARAHIAGCSMGGMIAQLVALNHRDKVRSLTVIFSTPGDIDLPPSSREAHLALITPPPSSDREAVIAHILDNRRAYASTAFATDNERSARHIGQIYDRMYYPEGGMRHMSAIVAALPRGERLKTLDLPALVLHGSVDTLLPPTHGRRVAEYIKGAGYHEIEGWGHDIPPGVVPVLLGYMLPFIEKVERGR